MTRKQLDKGTYRIRKWQKYIYLFIYSYMYIYIYLCKIHLRIWHSEKLVFVKPASGRVNKNKTMLSGRKQSQCVRTVQVWDRAFSPRSLKGIQSFCFFTLIIINDKYHWIGKYTTISVWSTLRKKNLFVGLILYQSASPHKVFIDLFQIWNDFLVSLDRFLTCLDIGLWQKL